MPLPCYTFHTAAPHYFPSPNSSCGTSHFSLTTTARHFHIPCHAPTPILTPPYSPEHAQASLPSPSPHTCHAHLTTLPSTTLPIHKTLDVFLFWRAPLLPGVPPACCQFLPATGLVNKPCALRLSAALLYLTCAHTCPSCLPPAFYYPTPRATACRLCASRSTVAPNSVARNIYLRPPSGPRGRSAAHLPAHHFLRRVPCRTAARYHFRHCRLGDGFRGRRPSPSPRNARGFFAQPYTARQCHRPHAPHTCHTWDLPLPTLPS